MFLKRLFRKDSGRKDSKAVFVKPDMVLDERWLSFVDCYYLEKATTCRFIKAGKYYKRRPGAGYCYPGE